MAKDRNVAEQDPTNPVDESVKEQLEQAEEGIDGRSSKGKLDEEFRDQQRVSAQAQNLQGENAVPEQRPQATQEVLPSHQSAVYQDLLERDELPSQEPMPREAYEKAASDSQKDKAAKEARTPRLFDGARVKVLREPYKDRGAVGAVIRVEFDDEAEGAKARSGDAALNSFAEPSRYIVQLRGIRNEQLSLEPDEVREISVGAYEASEA